MTAINLPLKTLPALRAVCSCETRSLALGEEQKLWVFGSNVISKRETRYAYRISGGNLLKIVLLEHRKHDTITLRYKRQT